MCALVHIFIIVTTLYLLSILTGILYYCSIFEMHDVGFCIDKRYSQ